MIILYDTGFRRLLIPMSSSHVQSNSKMLKLNNSYVPFTQAVHPCPPCGKEMRQERLHHDRQPRVQQLLQHLDSLSTPIRLLPVPPSAHGPWPASISHGHNLPIWKQQMLTTQKCLKIFQSYLESPACESSLPKNSKPSFAHLTASPVEYLFPAALGALPKAWLSIFKYPLARPGPEICSSPTLPSTTATGRSTSAIAPVVQNPRSTARKASGQPMDTTPAAVSFASKVVVSTAASVGP